MSMSTHRTDTGGLLVRWDTPEGVGQVRFNSLGNAMSWHCEPRDPVAYLKHRQKAIPTLHREIERQNRPQARRVDGPGTWLAGLLRVLTLGLLRPCTTCKSRARKLDAIGWRGLVPALLTRILP